MDNRLLRAINTAEEPTADKQNVIKSIIVKLKNSNPNEGLAWLYEQKRCLEQKSYNELITMV